MHKTLYQLSEKLRLILTERKLFLAVAESCTGGMIAETITSASGSSNYFDRGFVTYSNAAKVDMLNVKEETLAKYGAVSAETVREMVEGAIKNSKADIGIAVTGIAGPTSDNSKKPVGLVFFSWHLANKTVHVEHEHFTGDREIIRQKSVQFALSKLIEFLK